MAFIYKSEMPLIKKEGVYNVYVDGKFCIETIMGQWDMSDGFEYSIDYGALVRRIQSPWVKIVDLNMWEPTPAIVQIIGLHLEFCRTHGLLYSANVCLSQEQRDTLTKMFDVGGTCEISKFFKDRNEAYEWLATKGFQRQQGG